jgi:hypothetical protein
MGSQDTLAAQNGNDLVLDGLIHHAELPYRRSVSWSSSDEPGETAYWHGPSEMMYRRPTSTPNYKAVIAVFAVAQQNTPERHQKLQSCFPCFFGALICHQNRELGNGAGHQQGMGGRCSWKLWWPRIGTKRQGSGSAGWGNGDAAALAGLLDSAGRGEGARGRKKEKKNSRSKVPTLLELAVGLWGGGSSTPVSG